MARILFLYSEMMPYMEATIRSLVEDFGDEVIVVSWDKRKLTPNKANYPASVKSIARSKTDSQKIKAIIESFKPKLIYVSGRMDKGYLTAIRSLKAHLPVVAACDNQWNGSIKQILAVIFSRSLYRKYFSHLWVPGPYQYEFARRMGFRPSEIIFNLYAGNSAFFSERKIVPHREKKIVFVGRLERIKGVDLLVEAFTQIAKENRESWKLILIGEGSMRKEFSYIVNVECTGFLSQELLIEKLDGDCIFCLPSRSEPWGVVIHEMACAGLPIIASEEVGAAKDLVIPGFNGFTFPSESVKALSSIMHQMISISEEERLQMGRNSRLLGSRFSSTMAAASLRSVLS